MDPLIKKLKNGYSYLWKAFIRPPRQTYTSDDLGDPNITLDDGFEVIR